MQLTMSSKFEALTGALTNLDLSDESKSIFFPFPREL